MDEMLLDDRAHGAIDEDFKYSGCFVQVKKMLNGHGRAPGRDQGDFFNMIALRLDQYFPRHPVFMCSGGVSAFVF